MDSKTVILGIDGVPYDLMNDLSEQGVMSNFQQLEKEGEFKEMRSSIPHISSVSWSSIITGENPGQHGTFGFTDIIPGTYSLNFPDFNSLKKPAFWLENGKKNIIINVPSTYPPKEMNGVHISGFISLDLKEAVYPPDCLKKIKEFDYQVDIDSSIAHKSKSLFIEKLFETLEARKKAYRHFWNKENWDLFMLVITGSDRLEHFLWDAYEDENHEYHKDFLNYFEGVDEIIGEIAEEVEQKDNLIFLSDHGMERIKTNFNVNYFLQEKGFLNLDKEKKSYNQIDKGTKVFALDPGRIYLNKKDKFPNGKVEAKEEQEVIEKVTEAFLEVEKDGEKIISKVYPKEEIYNGPELVNAPDLILIENSGFRLQGKIDKDELFSEDVFTGKHTPNDSFLYLKSERSEMPENPTVEDVVKLL